MNVYTSRANKDLHNSETRKQPVRLGRIQKLILEFASEHLYISASEVSVWAKERGVNVSVKRIHDALKRLMQRNIVEKISHGVYRLTEYGKKLLSILLSCKQVCRRDKETELPSFAGVGDGVRRYVVRLHSRNSRSVEDVIRQLYAMKKIIECGLRFLRSLVGKSRFYRIVRGVDVRCVDVVVGGHGVVGKGRDKSLRRELKPLSYFRALGLRPMEVGVDVEAVSNVVLSIKNYVVSFRSVV